MLIKKRKSCENTASESRLGVLYFKTYCTVGVLMGTTLLART
nr:MAG TPA: hypothetical protein [Caudoviricetes sp.]